MATPNSSKPSHPPPHYQAMTPNSLTNHLSGLSPMPSHHLPGHSPAQLSKRSPPNNNTTGAFNQHGHFLRRSQSSNNNIHPTTTLTYDSPTAAALGLSLHLPGLDHLSSTPMPGRGGVGGGVPDDNERKRRLERIVERLRSRVGRVSEEGLERLANRTDLECLWDDGPGGARILTMAGTGVLLEIEFRNQIVVRVELSFPTASKTVKDAAPRAEKILQKALMRSERERVTAGINHSLAPFATHLERLTVLDKLSSMQLNCYEAVGGIYASLKKIFEWEVQRVRNGRNDDDDNEEVEKEVLCKRSGRPRMHAGERLGLSLEYWMPRRYISGKKRKRGSNEEDGVEGKTYAAIIECEAAPAELSPPIRISKDWVSEGVVRNAQPGDLLPVNRGEQQDQEMVIDWLEPPSTYVSAGDGPHHTTREGIPTTTTAAGENEAIEQLLPNVRFIATFDPPVIVPLQVAYQIYISVGQQIPQESSSLSHTYDEMILGGGKDIKRSIENGRTRVSVENRKVGIFDSNGVKTREEEHRYELYIAKPEYAQVITSLPFSHPRQLVGILP
ncbi:MAG: hypothetical protein M1823_000628 [Watsoniomyces obsoletus]|nr:MAG: hypothetical protein M1823_000628 [Watsoniomyces obsoletus]